MKACIVFALCAIISSASAQQTRMETPIRTATREDLKANNDSIPDGVARQTAFKRVEVLRFKFHTDLLRGLERVVAAEQIRNAVILAGIGSVRGYRVHVVSSRRFPTRNTFIVDTTGAADIASMNGYIFGGRVHAHITLANTDRAFGGHLEEGTEVYTFAIVTIGVLDDAVDLGRMDDASYR